MIELEQPKQVAAEIARRNYVIGFMFDENRENVVLIRKNKPDWQKGLLNGVGGKVELGERFIEAMTREFKEEAGVETSVDDWSEVGTFIGKFFCIYFFACYNTDFYNRSTKSEAEEIVKIEVRDIGHFSNTKTMDNLMWMLHLALDFNPKHPFHSKTFYRE